ncbi:MAG: RNA methyltransferase, partial [Bacteroidota bacterium]|nr:RNA methyltransferase [Bacteroidota bacterium]
LLLDSIRNPGNLGTIIRIADWYNIKQIICSPDCVDVYNPKVVQSTMGSIFRVKIIYQELGEFIDNNNEYNYYNAELNGENIHTLKFKKPTAIIIGNESTGVSDNLTKKVKNKISIPKYGNAESLNAAVATGIIFDNMLRLTSGDKNSKALQKNK